MHARCFAGFDDVAVQVVEPASGDEALIVEVGKGEALFAGQGVVQGHGQPESRGHDEGSLEMRGVEKRWARSHERYVGPAALQHVEGAFGVAFLEFLYEVCFALGKSREKIRWQRKCRAGGERQRERAAACVAGGGIGACELVERLGHGACLSEENRTFRRADQAVSIGDLKERHVDLLFEPMHCLAERLSRDEERLGCAGKAAGVVGGKCIFEVAYLHG